MVKNLYSSFRVSETIFQSTFHGASKAPKALRESENVAKKISQITGMEPARELIRLGRETPRKEKLTSLKTELTTSKLQNLIDNCPSFHPK